MSKNVLYIHGMGGGGDSRIPAILNEVFSDSGNSPDISIVVRTYDFDPEIGHLQIRGWVEELKPSLVIGESLGSLHALRVAGVPRLLVSPSLNAPVYLGRLSFLACLPGVRWCLDRWYRPKPGDRQKLCFTYNILRKYTEHRRRALALSPRSGSNDSFYAFFGRRDHYRRTGVVSVRTYEKYFGKSYRMYDGTHFMEEEFVRGLLVPKIIEMVDY